MTPRTVRLAFASLGLLAALLQVLGWMLWRNTAWGFHLLAFLPAGVSAAIAAGWVLACVALLLIRDPAAPHSQDAARLARRPGSGRRALSVIGFTAVAAFCFAAFSSRQTVLGDAWLLVTSVSGEAEFQPRQPLASMLQHAAYDALGGTPAVPGATPQVDSPQVRAGIRSARWLSVLAGIVFVGAACALGADLLARGAASSTQLLATLLLCGQGFALLFFGYLEVYSQVAAGWLLFLWTGWRAAERRLPLAVPLVLWVAAVGMHVSSAALLPAVGVLMIAALRDPHRRRPAMRDLVVAVAAIVALDRLLASQPGGAGLWSLARSMLATATGDQGNGAGPSYLFSWRHLRDFVNEQFLIGPWALALFLAALLVTWRRRALGKPSRGTGETVSPAVAFVSVAAAAVAVASWIAADPALGYPRDWDAFAPSGVAFVVAGIALLSRAIPEPWLLRRVLATLVVTSLLHLCAWVALNHSEARAMERFATLPLGMGRTELVIGNWYRRQGAPEEAERWLLAAVEAAPDNSNAWALLGQLAADRHDLRAVAAAYEKAVALRPDKSLYRQNLARAYEYDGRYRDALAQYARLAQSDPGFLENWIRWARMALACGDTAQARAVVARARPALEQFARERPAGPLWAEVRELLALPTR